MFPDRDYFTLVQPRVRVSYRVSGRVTVKVKVKVN